MKHQIVLVSPKDDLWDALLKMRKFKKNSWVLLNADGLKKLNKKSSVIMKGNYSSIVFFKDQKSSIEFQPFELGKLGLYYRILTIISKDDAIKFNVNIPKALILINYQK